MKEIEIKVIWMGSHHCAWNVKKALEALEWVEEAITDFVKWSAKIKYNSEIIEISMLKKAVDNAWYEAIIT